MSDFTDAFEDLLDCQEATGGTREHATIGSVTADAFIEALTMDEVIVAGGVAESGGFKIMMRSADFALEPAKNTAATAKGKSLYVLSVKEANGTYEITIGDPAAL